MNLLRKLWFRLIIAISLAVAFNLFFFDPAAMATLRENSAKALQSVTVIFSIASALSLALLSNSVRGVRYRYLDQVRVIRNEIRNFYSEFKIPNTVVQSKIISKMIIPLLQLNSSDWCEIDNVLDKWKGVEDLVSELKTSDVEMFLTHLLPIEDEISELGLLYVRSVITQLLVDIASGTFLLIVFAIGILTLNHILPSNLIFDTLAAIGAIIVILYAMIELLLVLSFIKQEARNELVEDPLTH